MACQQDNPDACRNVKRSPEGFDGEQMNCKVCGYYRFIEGRYYRWVKQPVPTSTPL